ncbi:MAG: hypothetical protein ACI9LM_004149 [Alteromonadaceae bacterium]|jgi:hypothetical protein
MHNKRRFVEEAFIKRYSVPVGLIGLALTAMSTFGFTMEGTFKAYNFWAAMFFLIAIIILMIIALDLAVKELNKYVNSRFNVGELPPVLSICDINNKANAKIILHPKDGMVLQKDTVVSVILADDLAGDLELGLGVITDQQTDGKIALVATPKRNMINQWNQILSKSSEYTNKIRVRTIIDRNYVNDDYLYKENYDIGNLSQSADAITTDGAGVKL